MRFSSDMELPFKNRGPASDKTITPGHALA
jgi:hypothetical protein